MKNRCVTSGLSAWSYINFAEILLVTKVHLVLAEPKAQARKWEELFLSLNPVGGIALHLLPGSLPDASISAMGVLFLAPLNVLVQRLQTSLTFQLVLKHLISAVDKTSELFTSYY